MTRWHRKGMAILTALLLLISTFLPHIQVKAASEEIAFTMGELEGYEFYGGQLKMTNSTGESNLVYVSSHNGIDLAGFPISETETYTLEIFGNFGKRPTEEVSEGHHESALYYGKKVLNGAEWQQGLTWTLEDDLLVIEPDFTGFDLNLNAITLYPDEKYNDSFSGYVNTNNNAKLLISPTHQLHTYVSGKDLSDQYFHLAFKTPQSPGKWSLAAEKQNALKVTFNSAEENTKLLKLSLHNSKNPTQGLYMDANEGTINEIFLTPGTYDMDLTTSPDGTNEKSTNWHVKSVSIDQPKEFEYTAHPNKMDIKRYSINDRSVDIDTTLYGGDFIFGHSQNSDLIGKAQILDENNQVVNETVNPIHDLTYFWLETEGLEGQTYTISTQVVHANDGTVYASASKEVELPGRKDKEIKGTVVTAEDLEGHALEDAMVRLYEKGGNAHQEATAAYPLDFIFETKIETNNDTTDAFIPNAYLLQGKEYELVVEGFMKNNQKIVYHQTITGGAQSTIHFSKENLKKISFQTNKTYSEQDVVVAIVDPKQDLLASLPISINPSRGNIELFMQTSLKALVLGRFYDEELKEGTMYSKLIQLEEDTSIVLEEESFADILAPSGYEEAWLESSSEWDIYNASKLRVNRDFYEPFGIKGLQVNIHIQDKEDYFYSFTKSIPEIQDRMQLSIPNTFIGHVEPNHVKAGVASYLNTHYRNDQENITLEHVSKAAPAAIPAGNMTFQTRKGDGTTQKWAVTEENGLTSYQEQKEDSPPAARAGGVNGSLLQYQLYKDGEPIGEPMNSPYTFFVYFLAPEEVGDYQLKLLGQSIPTDVVKLQLDSLITVGQPIETNESNIAIELTTGDPSKALNNQHTTLFRINKYGQEAYPEYIHINRYENRIEASIPNLKDDDEYVIVTQGQFYEEQPPYNYSFSNSFELSGAELKQQESLDVLQETVKVEIQKEFSKGVEFHDLQASAKIAGTKSYHSTNLYVHGSQNSVYIKPGDYQFQLRGYSGEEAYFLLQSHNIDRAKEISFSDKQLSQVTLSKEDGTPQSFQQVSVHSENVHGSPVGYYYPYQKGVLKTLYVSPGDYRLGFHFMKTESNETPWGYEFSVPVNASKDVDLPFNGFDLTLDIKEILTWKAEGEDATNVQAEVANTSGNWMLERVYVFRENPPRTFALLKQDPIREYEGDFDNAIQVPSTVKVIDTATNRVIYQTEGKYGQRYFHFPIRAAKGQFQFIYEQPIGPKKSITASKSFTIGDEQEDVVDIQSPATHSVMNSRSITVNGKATPSKEITVEATKGTSSPVMKTVTADEQGAYSVTLLLPEDGTYRIQSFLKENRDIHSNQVTVEVDTVKPAIPANVTANQGKNVISVAWDAVEDVTHYILYSAKKGEEFAKINVTTNSYEVNGIQPGTTYQFKVAAVDRAGNESDASPVKEVTTSGFVVTSLKVNTKVNANQLLSIGDEIEIIMDGSYAEGYKGMAEVSVERNGIQDTKTITLVYDSASKQYKGQTAINEGTAKILAVKSWIENEGEKTEAEIANINQEVGATLKGTITENAQSLTQKASVRLVGQPSLTAETDEKGQFIFTGVPNGDYTINVTYPAPKGKMFLDVLNGKVTLVNGTTKELENAIDVPAYRDVQIKFVESGEDKKVVQDELSVRLTGPNRYTAYGYIDKDGYFTSNGTTTLRGLQTGLYEVKVYASGRYKETNKEIVLTRDHDATKPIEIEVEPLVKEIVDVVLDFSKNKNLTNIDYISLFSWDAYSKYGYSELGNYYITQQDLQDGTITIPGVAYGDDYELYVYEEGYRYFSQSNIKIDAKNQSITVDLDQGRILTGTVVDENNTPIKSGNVYAFSATSYAYTAINQDGTFELIGLSSDEDITLRASAPDYFEEPFTIQPKDPSEVNITLKKASFISGRVVDKEGKPLQHVYIQAYKAKDGKLGDYAGWTRSSGDGYFKIRNIKPGDYYIELSHYDFPSRVYKEGDQYRIVKDAEDVTFTLQEETNGSFTGKGNVLSASKQTVVPGKTIQYRLNYQNNGDGDANEVRLNVNLPENVELLPKTVLLNGKKVETWNNGSIPVGTVKKGESGALTFEVTVNALTKEPTVYTTASIQSGAGKGEVVSASTNILFVTLQAPSTTSTKKVKVYGSAKPGTTVEVLAGSVSLAKVKAEGRWWFADATLPVKEDDKEAHLELRAKITENGEAVISEPVTVKYAPNVPAIDTAIVSAGWNGEVSLNPYTGVATFAIVEGTPLNTDITFTDEVDAASITFLGKTYEMQKNGEDGKTFTFDGSLLGRWSSYGEQLLEVTFTKGDVTITLPLMEIIVLIDPSGFVFEGSLSNPLEGVTATVEEEKGKDNWVKWNAAFFGQINPQVTDENGRYGWDVIQGNWRVIFSKPGYDPYTSRTVVVPPPETELNVPLVRSTDPQIVSVTPSNNSENVKKDASITVTFDRLMNIASASDHLKLYKVNGDQKTLVTGTVTPMKIVNGYKESQTAGYYEEDTTKKLAKAFTFQPNAQLDASAAYSIEVNGAFTDYAAKQLGATAAYSFTTEEEETKPGNPNNPPPSGGGTPPVSKPEVKDGALVIPSDLVKVEGKKATVDETSILSQLEKVQNIKELVLKATNLVHEVVLSGAFIEALKAKGITDIEVDIASLGSYRLPLKEVDAKALAKIVVAASPTSLELFVEVKPSEVALDRLKGMTIQSKAVEFSAGIRYNGKTAHLDRFSQYVDRTIPLSKSVPADKTTALKLTKDGFVPVPTVIKGKEAIIKGMSNGTYVIVTSDRTFSDVNNGANWAEAQIESLASKFIIKGRANGQFAPEANMTRAEFAVLLVRALGLEGETYDGRFKDVKGTEWFNTSGELMAAVKHGLIKGKENGAFAPNETITREQAAVMIARVLDLKFIELDDRIFDPTKKTTAFKDHSAMADWSKASIEKVYQSGIMNGKNDGTFDPTGETKRDQMAKILAELLGKLF